MSSLSEDKKMGEVMLMTRIAGPGVLGGEHYRFCSAGKNVSETENQ